MHITILYSGPSKACAHALSLSPLGHVPTYPGEYAFVGALEYPIADPIVEASLFSILMKNQPTRVTYKMRAQV